MKHSLAKKTILALGAATTVLQAQETSFKAYGFMDANYEFNQHNSNNFLTGKGYVSPNPEFYVNHVNTYLDWKPNDKVRVLLELSLNRDPSQVDTAGVRMTVDSAALYKNLYGQFYGMMTQAGLPPQVAQMLASDSAAKYRAMVSQSVNGVRRGTPGVLPKDHGIEIPRVHVDLALKDLFSLRVGKWITPSGIWNVDHGSPIILTVNQPNQTAFLPIFPVSQTGVQAFGRSNVGDHDLSYAAWISSGRGNNFTGSSDYAQTPKNIDDWAVGTHLQSDLDFGAATWRLGATGHTGTERGEGLLTNVPVVGYDLSKAGTAEAIQAGGLETMTTSGVDQSYQRDWIYGLDTKLKWKGLTLQGEWNHRKVLNLMVSDNPATDINAWYGLVAYEIPLGSQFNVTPYYMHERIEWSKTQNNPALGLAGFPMNGWTIDQVGLNFGLWSIVHVKIEWAHNVIDPVNVSDRSSDFFNKLSDDDLTVERYAAQLSVAY